MEFNHGSIDFPNKCYQLFSFYRNLNKGYKSGKFPYVFNSIFTYDDIKEALINHTVFSSVMPEINELLLQDAGALIENDPPVHTEYRKIVQPYIYLNSNKILKGKINDSISKILSNSLEKEIDAVESIGGLISTNTICNLVGISQEGQSLLRDWTNRFSNSVGNELVSTNKKILEEQKNKVTILQEELTYFLKVESEKLSKDSNALLNVYKNWNINEKDALGIIKSLAFAGNHTTSILIANALYLFGKNKEQLLILKSDIEKYIMPACNETLRYMSVFRGVMRKVIKPYTLKSGHKFEVGDFALLWIASANRDIKYFVNPNKFDITRKDKNKNLAFGLGVHYCIGFQLAIYQLEQVLRNICLNSIKIEILSEPTKISDPWVEGFDKLKVILKR